MSILLSAVLSAGLVSFQEVPNRIEYDNQDELKVKILELLKEKKHKIKPKPPEKVENKEKVESKLPVKKPVVEAPSHLEKEKVEELPFEVNSDYLLKPAAFALYLEKYKVADEVVKVKINSHQDMHEFTTKMLKDLPRTVHMTSPYFNKNELKTMYEEAMSLKVEELTPTKHGLANYSIKTTNQVVITDTSNKNYNAATIQKAVDMYVKDLVPLLKGATEIETIQNVYDFMFENFDYTANNYRDMLVGNLGSGEMACNGFSYLADQLFEEAGITSYIRAGNSHYWNVLTLADGSEVTFDVTTDIVIDKYKATLGASTKQHIEKASTIGFYSAEYLNGKYHEVYEHSLLKGSKE